MLNNIPIVNDEGSYFFCSRRSESAAVEKLDMTAFDIFDAGGEDLTLHSY